MPPAHHVLQKRADHVNFKSEQYGPSEKVQYYYFMSYYVPPVKAMLEGNREACRAIDRWNAISAQQKGVKAAAFVIEEETRDSGRK